MPPQVAVPGVILVRSTIERRFFRFAKIVIPLTYLLRAYVVEQCKHCGIEHLWHDEIRLTMEVGFVVGIILANSLFESIPSTFVQLLLGNAAQRHTKDHYSRRPTHAAFISWFDSWLNNTYRVVLGILFTSAAFTYYRDNFNELEATFNCHGWGYEAFDRLLYGMPPLIYYYFAGIIAWKIIITVLAIRSIPGQFDVTVQPGHPDEAGGLSPVGNLAIKMIYVATVPTLVSTLFVVLPYLARAINPDLPKPNARLQNSIIVPGVMFAGIFGSLFALVPVFRFHKVMIDQKIAHVALLERVAARVVHLKGAIAGLATQSDSAVIEEVIEELDVLEGFYRQHRNINTWPIGKRTLLELWATQTALYGQVLAFWPYLDILRNL